MLRFDEIIGDIDAFTALSEARHDRLKVFVLELTLHKSPQFRHFVLVLGCEPFALTLKTRGLGGKRLLRL